MFNTYSSFLRDYGLRNLNVYIDYILFFVLIWFFIIAIKKVVRFPNKFTLRLFKCFVFLNLVITVGFCFSNRDNISLMFKNINDDKEFVYELNKTFTKKYPKEYSCEDYYLSSSVEKVRVPGTKKYKLNYYYYKVNRVTTRNISNALDMFSYTNYAPTSDFVSQIDIYEYTNYIKEIEDINKAKISKVDDLVVYDKITFKINKENMLLFNKVSRGNYTDNYFNFTKHKSELKSVTTTYNKSVYRDFKNKMINIVNI